MLTSEVETINIKRIYQPHRPYIYHTILFSNEYVVEWEALQPQGLAPERNQALHLRGDLLGGEACLFIWVRIWCCTSVCAGSPEGIGCKRDGDFTDNFNAKLQPHFFSLVQIHDDFGFLLLCIIITPHMRALGLYHHHHHDCSPHSLPYMSSYFVSFCKRSSMSP